MPARRRIAPYFQGMKLMLVAASVAVAALAVAAADLVSFIAPSGNIACLSQSAEVRCDIIDRDWSPPPRPADCPSVTGYGQGITLGATGPAQFVCAGDTVFGDSSEYVLDYGQTHSLPGYACDSSPSGIRCTNGDNHGFSLSRQAYTLF